MNFSPADPYLSPAEYLKAEKNSPIKHEYIQGKIYARAGASDAHGTIAANLLRCSYPDWSYFSITSSVEPKL